MRALLDDPAVIDHQNHIRVHNRRKPVRDHKARAAAHQFVHGVLDEQLRAGIHVRGCLVQDQDAPVGQIGAGNGQQLLLAAADIGRFLVDHRVVSIRQGVDKEIDVRAARGLEHLLARGVPLAIGNVVIDRPGEQPGILQHHAEARAKGCPVHGPRIHAVDRDRAGIHIVKPHEQVHDRRLAAARRTDDGDLLSRRHVDAQVLDQRMRRIVGEADMVKRNPLLPLRHGAVCSLLHLLAVEQLVHAPGRSKRMLHGGQAARDALERAGEELGVQDEGHHIAHAQRAGNGQIPAEDADEDIGDVVGHAHDRLHNAGEIVAPLGLGARAPAQLRLPRILPRLQMKRLDGIEAGIVLLVERIDLAGGLAVIGEVLFAPAGDFCGEHQRQRHKDHDAQRHDRLDQKHDHDDADQLQKARNGDVQEVVHGVAEHRHIVHHARDHLAVRRFIHEPDGQAADLIADANANRTGEMPRDHVVHDEHRRQLAGGREQIDPRQQQALPQKRRRLDRRSVGPEGVEHVRQRAQQLRPGQHQRDRQRADERREDKPAADRLRIGQYSPEYRPVVSRSGALVRFFHTPAPPNCDSKISR